jgi:putative ABC transport system substrate-binding protein
MNRRTFLSGAATLALARPLAAQAPAAGKTAHIGILTLRPRNSPMNDALMEGLRERGYVEGRNLVIEFPDALGREDRLPGLAAELVRKRVDLILLVGPPALAAARNATKTIPLVMVASSSDPVAEGVAASLSRPGGNITGLTYAVPDRFKKQLEVLKTAAPRVARVAALWDFDFDDKIYRRDWESPLKAAGQVLGLTIQEPVRVRDSNDLSSAFATMKQRQTDAFIVAAGGITLFPERKRVAELAVQNRLPAIAAFKEFAQAGLLLSYGPDLADINRRAAGYVARILKGAKPADMPIEMPDKMDLVINLGTAKALGLDIPQSLRLRADDVIQ